MAEIVLKYTGKDPATDWLPDVPARDLTEEDIKELGLRVARVRQLGESPLYKLVEPKEPKPRKPRKARAPRAPKPAPEIETPEVAPVLEPMTVEDLEEGDN